MTWTAKPAAPRARSERTRVGVLGASGYTGLELLRLLGAHPKAEVVAASSRQYAGQPLGRACAALSRAELVLDDDPDDPAPWVERGVEVVFSALPHGAFAARARRFLDAGLRIVDLSADFRLRDAAEYARRYGMPHPDPESIAHAAYGLTEWTDSESLRRAALVANPGCYATATLLALLPAVAAGWPSGAPIVVNALSGVSGAGRGLSATTHFVECTENAAPYKPGDEHAQCGEIRQALGTAWPRPASAAAEDAPLVFTPHLVPMARGILASVALPLAGAVTAADAAALYRERYARSPCVRVLDPASLPETRWVRGSNRCDIALRVSAGGRMLLVFAAIDNLGKGAAGQAIQNWNHMQGWSETTGLSLDGWMVA